jgi:serine protease DegQ
LNVVAQIKPGTPTKVHVVRKGKEFDLTVVIGKRPPPPKQALSDQEGDDTE